MWKGLYHVRRMLQRSKLVFIALWLFITNQGCDYQQAVKDIEQAERSLGMSIGSPYVKVDGQVYEAKAVVRIAPGSRAEKAGVKMWDILLDAYPKQFETPDQLLNKKLPSLSESGFAKKLLAIGDKPFYLIVLRPSSTDHNATYTKHCLNFPSN